MRTFNANFITEKNKRADGPKPINLLTFSFAAPVYLSDRDVTPSGGSAHKGLVKSWGFLDSSIAQTLGSGILGAIEICDLQLTIINTESPRFSDNFTDTDPPENVTVTLYQWFGGLLYSEKEIIFKGLLYGQPKYDEYTCTLTVRGIFEKYNKQIGADLIIDADTYPNADPDDIGKMSNICIGTLPNVPCRSVKAGAVDTLTADLTAAAVTFVVSGSGKIEFPSGTVVVQIDAEQISGTYTPATNTFSACTRGYNSTSAVAHGKGASVAEVLTTYVYEVAGHPAKAITAVYVDGVLQSAGFTAYTGQAGDELAGYEGKAVIKFTALPVVSKSVTIAISDGVTVSDDIAVATPSTTKSIYPSGGTANVIDGSEATYAALPGGAVASFPSTSYGTIIDQYIHVSAGNSGGALTLQNSSGWSPASISGPSAPSKYRLHKSGGNWADGITFGGVGALYEVWEKEVIYTPSDPKSGNAYRSGSLGLIGNSTAETVIGRLVTADVDGYPDDGAGTYTGTPNALIERPDHVFKFIWGILLGAPSGDIDSATFTAAGAFYAANGYKFTLLINGPVAAADLLMRLALQCRSRFFVTPYGTAKLLVRQLGQASGHAIIKSEIKRDSVSIERSPTTEIINLFNISYGRDLTKDAGSPESYGGSKNFQSAASITRYGQREWKGAQALFCFDAVRDAVMAEDVGDFLLAYHCRARKMPHFGVFLDNMEIEPGDIIDVTHPLDASGFVAEVQKILHHIGSKSQVDWLEITGVENAE